MGESISARFDRTVLWQALLEPGLEHLRLQEVGDRLVADGMVIGMEEGIIFRLHYMIELDRAYQFQRVELTLQGPPITSLVLRRGADGHWTNETGQTLPGLSECIDIDITATPFTNTLPIRRIDVQPGQSIDIDVAYISVPDLTVSSEPQRYTCLRKSIGQSVYRFESLTSGFTADIRVDAVGLVIDYPGLFQRVWPPE